MWRRICAIALETFQLHHTPWARHPTCHAHVEVEMPIVPSPAFQLDAKQFALSEYFLHGILPQLIPLLVSGKALGFGGRWSFNSEFTCTATGAHQRQ